MVKLRSWVGVGASGNQGYMYAAASAPTLASFSDDFMHAADSYVHLLSYGQS